VELDRQSFDALRRGIRELCGLVISDEKKYLIQFRLEPVAVSIGCRSFEELSRKFSCGDREVKERVIEAVTTGETSFFRDQHPFEAFRRHLLPLAEEALRRRSGSGPGVRIWCVGVSTGQEPYSVAMAILDHLAAERRPGVSQAGFSILATDVSGRALAVAAAGKYARRELERGLTPDQISRFFEEREGSWAIRKPVVKLVEFRVLNLVGTLPTLGAFDVIFCRNVLIYFDEETRCRIVRSFHTHLHEGGWLILGSAESLYGTSDLFEPVRHGQTLLYRKAPERR
jgi:chemotaxis protein methyltransferase CheR